MTHEEPSTDATVDRLAAQAHGAIDAAEERARRLASDVSRRTRAAGEHADDVAARAGRSLKSAAERLRERSSPQGTMGAAVGTVADSMDQVARYLEDDGFTRLRGDLEAVVRRNPVWAVLACAGVGYILARGRGAGARRKRRTE